MKTTYTTILHQAREELGITNNEYILADTIEKLSRPVCYATQKTLGEIVGINERNTRHALKRLTEKGLINNEPRKLTTTDKWKDKTRLLQEVEKTSKGDEKTSEKRSKRPEKEVEKTYYNNNIIIRDNNKYKLPQKFGSSTSERLLKLYSLMWWDKFGFRPTLNKRKLTPLIKKMTESCAESEIALMIMLHFDWRGTTGDDEWQYKRLLENSFPFEWIVTSINKYQVHLRNVCGVNTEKEEDMFRYLTLLYKDKFGSDLSTLE